MVAREDDGAGALGARLRLGALPGAVTLTTDRLLLREQTPEDVDALHAVLGDAETMSFYPRPFTRDEVADRWVGRNVRLYAEHGYGLWALERRAGGDVIGQCGLWPQVIEGDAEIEIAWHVNRSVWRQGYASEAAAAVRDHALGRLGIDRLVSIILPDNVASQGVARKIGMSPERMITHAGRPHILFVTGVVRPEP